MTEVDRHSISNVVDVKLKNKVKILPISLLDILFYWRHREQVSSLYTTPRLHDQIDNAAVH